MATGNTTSIGTHQEIHIGTFKVDRRGLISGSVQRHRKEPFDKIDWKYNRIGAAPPQVVPCVGVVRDYDNTKGMAIYTYSFEGLDPDGGDPDESQTTFELDITMEESPIEAHPNLKAIEAKYGTFDTRLKRFPRYLPAGQTADAGLTADDSAGTQKRNPLAGTDSYLSFGATFKKRYIRRFIPAVALRGIGTIISRPIGISSFPLPAAAKHRKWLKVAPNIVKRGNCVDITENFIMAGRFGIVKELYSAAALSEDDSETGGSSGLTFVGASSLGASGSL